MINAIKLQEKIIEHPEYIEKILDNLGFTNVKDRNKYFQFPNKDGDNNSAITILKSTLQYHNYTRDKQGNLFTLIMDDKSYNFPQTLEWVCDVIGENKNNLDQKIKYPFHGFYRNIIQSQTDPENSLKVYPLTILPPANNYSKMYLDDGISIEAQERFGIRYCHEDDCILTPIYNLKSDLVGVKARNNNNDDYNHRWYMWTPYQKTCVVYGLNFNYHEIITKNTLVIFESEKAVMQCYSFGFNCAAALGGHSISEVQAKIIKSLMVENIIVAFDEGICEEEIQYECKKLVVDNQLYKNKVSYLYDGEHRYLNIGMKQSPSDQGKDKFVGLMKDCRRVING